MATVISYVEIHVSILCTSATIEYLRVTYFVNEKVNNCQILRCVVLIILNYSYNFPVSFILFPPSRFFVNRTATVRPAACGISARKAVAPRRRRRSGAAAASPTLHSPPPLAANAARSLAQSSHFH